MIPCTDFIPAYSELFRFLEKKDGPEAVRAFWRYLADNFLHNLREMVEEHGIQGCWMYWDHTLNEEAADFTMEMDTEDGFFRVTMHECPSRALLNNLHHLEPYHDYCGHCDVLYRRVLAPLGYECTFDMDHCDQAQCTFTVRRRGEAAGE